MNHSRRNRQSVNKPKLQAGRDKVTCQVAIMSEHDRAVYFSFIQACIDDLNARNHLERQFARRIGQDNWRLNRLHAIEENIFAWAHSGPYKDMEAEHPQIHHAMIQALTFMDDPRLFALIALYEARITRNMQANLKMLFQLQSLPKPAPEIARAAAASGECGEFVLQNTQRAA